MTKHRPPKPPGDDYEIGYGRPPVTSRFMPGKSGNPKGRRKGSVGVAALLRAIVSRRITVRNNGVEKKMTLFEATLTNIVNVAAQGDLKAATLVLNLLNNVADDPSRDIDMRGLTAEDDALLGRFLARAAALSQDELAEQSSREDAAIIPGKNQPTS
jgi:hypothetical protein